MADKRRVLLGLVGLVVSACLFSHGSAVGSQSVTRGIIPQPGRSARLQVEVPRLDVKLAEKTEITISVTNATKDESFYVTKEIDPLTGGFPFHDYFIEVRPPNSEKFLESVQGFLHGDTDEWLTEDYWLKTGKIVLLKPGETHKATMRFTWEDLLWFLKREDKLVSGRYALRAVYYARRFPGEDNFRIPPLKESLMSTVVEVQINVP
jgi:hypothetical protein